MKLVVQQVMGGTDGGLLLSRRQGRGRVATLAFLMLVLVSSVALVGNSHKAEEDAAHISTSADSIQSEASLLSRLQRYPGIAARTGSFQRLGTAAQPAAQLNLPSASAGWNAADGEAAGEARAVASAKLQYMQMQVHSPPSLVFVAQLLSLAACGEETAKCSLV